VARAPAQIDWLIRIATPAQLDLLAIPWYLSVFMGTHKLLLLVENWSKKANRTC
jgi:hypothetical protein